MIEIEIIRNGKMVKFTPLCKPVNKAKNVIKRLLKLGKNKN